MKVKSIAECSKGSILQYFRPSLSYHFSIKTFVLCIFKWPLETSKMAIWGCNTVKHDVIQELSAEATYSFS